MHPWAFLVHLGNFVWPAVALATLLVPGVVGWRGLALRGSAARRLWRAWMVLCGLGVAVLAAGLAYWGRDGKMLTYAALVLVVGTAAAWLQSRR